MEAQHRAAIVAGSEGLETSTSTGGSEERELADLTRRSSIGEIFTGAIEHRATDGATAELQEHYKVPGNAVPLALLRGDRRHRRQRYRGTRRNASTGKRGNDAGSDHPGSIPA